MSKIYQKTLLAVMVAAALPAVIAATTDDDRTIYVTTTADEDNVNNSQCSLREAVTAAKTNKPYGGCIAGQYQVADQIKFKVSDADKKNGAQVYQLNSPIKIDSNLSISGEDAFTYDVADVVTNDEKARQQLKTIIKGKKGIDGFVIFDSSESKSPITLNSVILQDGGGSKGGAIRSGGMVNLNRVYILDSSASDAGGAIYLEGTSSSLTAQESIFYGNTAPRGAVLAMTCVDNLKWTQRSISIDRSSILNNGSPSSISTIDFCGTPTGSITASTIAGNTVSSSRNIKLTDEDPAEIGGGGTGVIRYKHDTKNVYPLHPNSNITLLSNTIVNNKGWATLLYDNVAPLTLAYNVLAFNDSNGKSCRYLPYELNNNNGLKAADAKINATFDAVVMHSKNVALENKDACYLPFYDKRSQDQRKLYPLDSFRGSENLDVFLHPLPPFTTDLASLNSDDKNKILKNYGFLPSYVPKIRPGISLLKGEGSGCSATDQRGLSRNIRLLDVDDPQLNVCDFGAIELSKLNASFVTGVATASISQRISDLEKTIKAYVDELAKPDVDPLRKVQYQVALADMKRALKALKIVDSKNDMTQRYRQVYVPVLAQSVEAETYDETVVTPPAPLDPSKPVEKPYKIGVKYYKFLDDKLKFNSADYSIVAEPLGRGSKSFLENLDAQDIDRDQAKYIKCIWNPVLKEVMVSRLEKNDKGIPVAVITPDGSAEYCKYTITLRSNPAIKSVGYIQATIANVAPVANDDKFTLKYGDASPFQMDILANDNDDGDGAKDVPGYPTGRNVFYQDPDTNSRANIIITANARPTTTGVETNLGYIHFEFVQPCPTGSTTSEEPTCYGGKMTYQPKNVLSPFNDVIKYKVLDADKQESNEATITIVNTATTTDDTRGNSGGSTGTGGGGGGSIGWLAIAGLGLLAAARRRLMH